MPSNSLPEPWNSFFSEIDAPLSEELELHCLGGFVMTILYGLPLIRTISRSRSLSATRSAIEMMLGT